MKSTSLEEGFIVRHVEGRMPVDGNVSDAVALLEAMSFDDACDFVSAYARKSVDGGHGDDAVALLSGIASHEAPGDTLLIRAALKQVIAAVLIEQDDIDGALDCIVEALKLLSENAKSKDVRFRSVLASLLYDLATVHAARNEYSAAERTIERSISIFDNLAKSNPQRYGSAHVYALKSATSIYRSRIKQVNLLAHYQVATSTYLSMAADGAPAAVGKLVDSLVNEAETLLKLGKPRDAVRNLSRALKYLDKTEDSFTLRKLKVSVMLGTALLHTFSTRQKGVHLLNTLLQKAKKMGATAQQEQIERLLDENTSSLIDMLSRWHKMFSRK
ncbi:MAG: hypothetical protein K2G47_08260 [Muribaculum sp.]|nr:hypothetical protein [Muribaculum sp.]